MANLAFKHAAAVHNLSPITTRISNGMSALNQCNCHHQLEEHKTIVTATKLEEPSQCIEYEVTKHRVSLIANPVTGKKKVAIFVQASAYCISLSQTYQIRNATSGSEPWNCRYLLLEKTCK